VTAGIETELKLRADEVALRSLAAARRIGPASLGSAVDVDEVDTYLDTDDGRLAAARWACRLRLRQGRRWISCKGPPAPGAGGALHRRPEVEGPGPEGDARFAAEWPPSAARDLVLMLAGDAPLLERLTLRQRRTERPVSVEGARVGTLSLDRVAVERGGTGLGGFAVVELELSPGAATGWLLDVTAALLAQPGLAPDRLSKLERGLELAGGALGAGR
jgi:inorganic triphosphatase YgiF